MSVVAGARDGGCFWVAAVSVTLGLPLLTRNVAEFERVPSLKIVDYTARGLPE
ncbi:MAG: hypothetical protein O3C57_07395 [Verrucomicrobia bacterium]|nr:hypothetical protein [Verrucomicrobiota bacterium]